MPFAPPFGLTPLQAQTLQIIAARNVRLSLVDFAKAAGGGWEYKTAVALP